jgi:hypothetical protein
MVSNQIAIHADDWSADQETFVQFRLLYQGRLLASSKDKTRPEHKHEIRTLLSPQLKKIWEHDPNLAKYRRVLGHRWINMHPEIKSDDLPKDNEGMIGVLNDFGILYLAHNWERAKQGFVPLVCSDMGLRCKLDILFLRPGIPGEIIRSGDIDNRLKTLFDSLKLPENAQALGNSPVQSDPIFCLLQDDGLVSELRVVTDHLLALPNQTEIRPNEVFLVIEVSLEAPPNTQWSFIF